MTEKYYKENAIIEAVANRISEWFDVSSTASYALIETALDDIASENIFFMADLLDKAYEQGKQDTKEENGEWIRVPHPSIPTDIFRCTKCGVYIKLPEKIDRMYYNFCPNCGKRNVNAERNIDNAK